MKRIRLTLFLVLTLAVIGFAQTDSRDVTITASGSGQTLDEAKQTALRNATEQAFGAFISSKTEIFNDRVVADQMASVSSGNIKSYDVLNEAQLPDGRWAVTLRASVSVDKLTSFAQAKGVSVEVKGGLYAMNIKQQMLNEQNEIDVIYDMVGVLHEVMQTAFDYEIQSGNPKSLDGQNKNWEIALTVTATANENMDICADYLLKTLEGVSLTATEVSDYKAANKKVYTVSYTNFRAFSPKPRENAKHTKVFHFRNPLTFNALLSFGSNWAFYNRNFNLKSGNQSWNGDLSIVPAQPRGWTEYKWTVPQPIFNGTYYPFCYYTRLDYYSRPNLNTPEEYNLYLNIPGKNQICAQFSHVLKLTLSELEQLTSFSVKSRSVRSRIKHGGYVLEEKNGKGIAIAVCNISAPKGLTSDNKTKKAIAESCRLGGYSDWRYPTKGELLDIYIKFGWNELASISPANPDGGARDPDLRGFDNLPNGKLGGRGYNKLGYYTTTSGLPYAFSFQTGLVYSDSGLVNQIRLIRKF